MTEEDNKTEHLYLMLISGEDLKTMAGMLANAEFWHSEMIRLQDENQNLRQLLLLHEQTIKRLEGRP